MQFADLYKFEDEVWTESDREDDKGNAISSAVDTGVHKEVV